MGVDAEATEVEGRPKLGQEQQSQKHLLRRERLKGLSIPTAVNVALPFDLAPAQDSLTVVISWSGLLPKSAALSRGQSNLATVPSRFHNLGI